MLNSIIAFALRQRVLVLVLAALIAIWGVLAMRATPIDALPELSDPQIIIRASYDGQTPQQIENQVTLPLSRQLLSIPQAKAIRSYSMLGDAFIHVVFEENVDYSQARNRVNEALNQALKKLPAGVSTSLGPDASGVSWIYQYALQDTSGEHDLSELRAIQDWQLRFELQAIKGVAEVATLGGMVKQYQAIIDPTKQQQLGISLKSLEEAIQAGNQEASGSVVELGEAEYAIHSSGYIQSLEDLANLHVNLPEKASAPILLKDIAQVGFAPQARQGIADLDGQGEAVGGIVIMQAGQNPLEVVNAVKAKLAQLQKTLPAGVKLVTTYDRSKLITSSISELGDKLWQESVIIALVCFVFLWSFRSSLVAIVSLPLGILFAFGLMHWQGINANIMSLGGIAIAIGAMVDAAIVMIENFHQHLQRFQREQKRIPLNAEHWQLVYKASAEVGPALFFCLLIITLSFLPVLLLEAQEGKLFAPLAYTKTYAMAAASGFALTLVPVLMGYLIKGRLGHEEQNPITQHLATAYQPLLNWSLKNPACLVGIALMLLISAIYPWQKTGNELMPSLDEGDLLYMPTTQPGLSVGKARELLIQTDQLIKTVPEVATVFGKAGRAETATDPAPLSMFETTIQLKPKSEWRAGLSLDDLIAELDQKVQVPGLTNAWVQPIKTRIDMLATGVRTPLGLKITGNDLTKLDDLGQQAADLLKRLPTTRSVFSDQIMSGRFIEITPDRLAAAQFGLSVADIQRSIRLAMGGETLSEAIVDRERYPISVRYPLYLRDNLERLRELPILTETGQSVPMQRVAKVEVIEAPAMIKSENAQLVNVLMLNLSTKDYSAYLADAQNLLASELTLPAGYQMNWVGQYEVMERVSSKLQLILPLMLAIVFLLLWQIFHNIKLSILVLATVPFALIGGFWYLWILDFQFSVATTIGFIALTGVATEFSVIMLLYLEQAWQATTEKNESNLKVAVMQGALTRLRPKLMTVAVLIAGLMMIMLGNGSGVDLMQPIAAPMLGGMITAPLLSMFLIPVAYFYLKRSELLGQPLFSTNWAIRMFRNANRRPLHADRVEK